MALAGLWLVIGVHCRLEFVPGLEFLGCATSHTPDNPADTHCDDNACRTLEAGHFLRAAAQTAPAMPTAVIPPGALPLADDVQPPQVVGPVPSTVPPYLLNVWQFFHRAALPPRAPSSVA